MPSFAAAILFAACTQSPALDSGLDTAAPAAPLDVQVTLSDIVSTVPTVRFDYPGAQAAWVHFGQDGQLDRRVAVNVVDGSGQISVLGMTPDATWQLQVEAQTDTGSVTSDVVEIKTGSPPNDLPGLTVDAIDPARSSPGFLVTGSLAPATAVIIDTDGNYVWWARPDDMNSVVRVKLSVDGQHILMGGINLQGTEQSEILRLAYDGTVVERIQTPFRHHDFTELPDGTLAWLTHDPQERAGLTVVGDRVMELAPGATEPVQVYSVWDAHEPGDSIADWVGPSGNVGWPHANAIDYLPDEDGYLVSFLHLDGIARIDRATGDELWFVGGDDSTLVDGDGGSHFFDGQHGFHHLGDTLLVFVNGQGSTNSHVTELALDPDQGSAREVWSYWPDPGLGTPVLGDVERLPNGNTLATFSFSGVVHEVDPDGQPVWSLSTAIGGALSFLSWRQRLQPE